MCLLGRWRVDLSQATVEGSTGSEADARAGLFAAFADCEGAIAITGFASKTNVPAAVFGEGSFDKGILWTIPFDAFLTSSSRFNAGFGWRPLIRDGAAKVQRPVDLIAETVWVSPKAKAYRRASPANDSVPPDDRVEPPLRP